MPIRLRRSRRKKAGVSSILGGAIIFAMIFTIGYGYFYTITQGQQLYQEAISANSALNVQETQEKLTIVTSQIGGVLYFGVNNTGITMSIVAYFVINSSSISKFNGNILYNKTYSPAQPVSQGQSYSLPGYSCGSSCNSWTYLIKVLTSRGNVFTGTYPQSSLVVNAVSAGAIGDLYLVFNTYTYYAIVSHSSQANCPSSTSNSSYTGYCLETASGGTGPGFDIPSTLSANIGFSVSMQNLNTKGADIILDQFSLMYQNSFYGNSHQNLATWYITDTGTPSNGFIPILKQYQPEILKYNVPKTIYYLSGTCVSASTGPTSENANCATVGTFNSPFGSGQVSTVFLLSNGWELLPNSYTLTQGGPTSIVYSGTGIDVNYGQNSPYVTTLYE